MHHADLELHVLLRYEHSAPVLRILEVPCATVPSAVALFPDEAACNAENRHFGALTQHLRLQKSGSARYHVHRVRFGRQGTPGQ